MNRAGAVFGFALATLTGCASGLIGQEVPPYPDGWTERQGGCTGPDPADRCAFSIGVLYSNGQAPKKILSQAFRRYVGKRARWTVLDQIDAPLLEDSEYLGFECRLDGRRTPGVIAVILASGGDWSPATFWARRQNFESGALEPVEPGRIECWNGLG